MATSSDEKIRPVIKISDWLIYLTQIGHNVIVHTLTANSEKIILNFSDSFSSIDEFVHLDFSNYRIVNLWNKQMFLLLSVDY